VRFQNFHRKIDREKKTGTAESSYNTNAVNTEGDDCTASASATTGIIPSTSASNSNFSCAYNLVNTNSNLLPIILEKSKNPNPGSKLGIGINIKSYKVNVQNLYGGRDQQQAQTKPAIKIKDKELDNEENEENENTELKEIKEIKENKDSNSLFKPLQETNNKNFMKNNTSNSIVTRNKLNNQIPNTASVYIEKSSMLKKISNNNKSLQGNEITSSLDKEKNLNPNPNPYPYVNYNQSSFKKKDPLKISESQERGRGAKINLQNKEKSLYASSPTNKVNLISINKSPFKEKISSETINKRLKERIMLKELIKTNKTFQVRHKVNI
jgi:hypothetical protein